MLSAMEPSVGGRAAPASRYPSLLCSQQEALCIGLVSVKRKKMYRSPEIFPFNSLQSRVISLMDNVRQAGHPLIQNSKCSERCNILNIIRVPHEEKCASGIKLFLKYDFKNAFRPCV